MLADVYINVLAVPLGAEGVRTGRGYPLLLSIPLLPCGPLGL